jgi:hypothetical protein
MSARSASHTVPTRLKSVKHHTVRMRASKLDDKMRQLRSDYAGTCHKVNLQEFVPSLQQPINYLCLVRKMS